MGSCIYGKELASVRYPSRTYCSSRSVNNNNDLDKLEKTVHSLLQDIAGRTQHTPITKDVDVTVDLEILGVILADTPPNVIMVGFASTAGIMF